MKTIRSKMLVLILLPVVVIFVGVTLIAYFQIKDNTSSTIEELTAEIAHKASDIVYEWISGLVKEVKTFAERNSVIEALKSGEWKDLMLNELAPKLKTRPYFEMFLIAYPDGSAPTSLGSVAQISDRGYFIEVMKQGADYAISNAIVSRVTGANVFVVAVPVKDNGKTIGLFGVTVTLDTISKIASEIKVGKAGYGFVVDSTGLFVAHPDKSIVMNLNILKSSEKGYEGLDKVGKEMLSEKTGFGKVNYHDL